jgi:hypothetical protein
MYMCRPLAVRLRECGGAGNLQGAQVQVDGLVHVLLVCGMYLCRALDCSCFYSEHVSSINSPPLHIPHITTMVLPLFLAGLTKAPTL